MKSNSIIQIFRQKLEFIEKNILKKSEKKLELSQKFGQKKVRIIYFSVRFKVWDYCETLKENRLPVVPAGLRKKSFKKLKKNDLHRFFILLQIINKYDLNGVSYIM